MLQIKRRLMENNKWLWFGCLVAGISMLFIVCQVIYTTIIKFRAMGNCLVVPSITVFSLSLIIVSILKGKFFTKEGINSIKNFFHKENKEWKPQEVAKAKRLAIMLGVISTIDKIMTKIILTNTYSHFAVQEAGPVLSVLIPTVGLDLALLIGALIVWLIAGIYWVALNYTWKYKKYSYLSYIREALLLCILIYLAVVIFVATTALTAYFLAIVR